MTSKSRKLRDDAFHQVIGQVPSRVKQVRRKQGKEAARRMQIAIALDEARKRGAKIPKP